jgi:arylformamidase
MELFDLTRPLSAGMPVLPGDPPVVLERVLSHEVDGYAVSRICLGSHSGTHLDTPRHFFPGGNTLDQYPTGRFVGPGLLLDVRPVPGAPPQRSPNADDRAADHPAGSGLIDPQTLSGLLRDAPMQPGAFVLLWTEGALLSLAAAQLLVKAGAGLVGTDGPSLDEKPYPVHRLLLRHDVLIAENLCGFARLGPGPVTCAFLPLAIAEADGAPVRAIAWR